MSTDAGTPPAAGDGRPPVEPEARPRRDLRDSAWGKVLLLALVLVLALLVSRACTNRSDQISQQEAVAIAIEHASFVPCPEDRCRQVRFLQQGVPPRPYWAIVLAEKIDAQGQPNRVESFLVNARTGAVTRR